MDFLNEEAQKRCESTRRCSQVKAVHLRFHNGCDGSPQSHRGCEDIGVCNCSGQFNNITPTRVMQDLSESATARLEYTLRQQTQEGTRTSSWFTHLLHRELENLVYFPLMTDVVTQASGKIWARSVAVSMARHLCT